MKVVAFVKCKDSFFKKKNNDCPLFYTGNLLLPPLMNGQPVHHRPSADR
jgi:hypothetical protein